MAKEGHVGFTATMLIHDATPGIMVVAPKTSFVRTEYIEDQMDEMLAFATESRDDWQYWYDWWPYMNRQEDA